MKSLEQVKEAVSSLTDPDLRKLKRYAQARLWKLHLKGHRYEADDLVQEALMSILTGSRHWPEKIDFFRLMHEAMRSISTCWLEKNREELLADLVMPGGESLLDRVSTTPNPEEDLMAEEARKRMTNLLAKDPNALT